MSDRPPLALFTFLCFGFAFLYIPIFILIVYSFNASQLVEVWGGFSFHWYGELFGNTQILNAALLSLEIGLIASTLSVLIGTPAAIALVRFPVFRGRLLLTGMVNAPMVLPEMITGVTQLLLFVSLAGVFTFAAHRGMGTLVIAHVAFSMSYVTVTVESRLKSADLALEEAAMDLGSGPVRAFLEITLPIIAPALASGWLLSFVLSIDDLVISQFVAGPGTNTLPMLIYSEVRLGVNPEINALSTIVILIVTTAVCIAGWYMHRAERRRVLDMQLALRDMQMTER